MNPELASLYWHWFRDPVSLLEQMAATWDGEQPIKAAELRQDARYVARFRPEGR